jgi:hypothetical protein
VKKKSSVATQIEVKGKNKPKTWDKKAKVS